MLNDLDRPRNVSAPIFISYSSKDQKIAETICRALEARGFDCWIAARNVGPGENFQEAIVKALRGARLMLLVFTSNANNSNEIKKEVVLAGRHHVTVVPVRVEDVVPNDALAYEFATRQWIDLFTDWEREIERLVTQIGSILTETGPVRAQTGDAGVPAPPAAAGKTPALRHLALVFPALLLLSLGAGAYLYLRPVVQPPALTGRFDGNWQATIACPTAGEAKSYTLQLTAQVKDGNFHGEHGIDGKPDSIAVDGRIQLDGSAELYAQGLTGDPRTTFGNIPPGSHFSYHIQAKFDGSSGTGSRIELRTCNFTALKR